MGLRSARVGGGEEERMGGVEDGGKQTYRLRVLRVGAAAAAATTAIIVLIRHLFLVDATAIGIAILGMNATRQKDHGGWEGVGWKREVGEASASSTNGEYVGLRRGIGSSSG